MEDFVLQVDEVDDGITYDKLGRWYLQLSEPDAGSAAPSLVLSSALSRASTTSSQMPAWSKPSLLQLSLKLQNDNEQHITGSRASEGPLGYLQSRARDVCGAYLSRLNNDRRRTDHFHSKCTLALIRWVNLTNACRMSSRVASYVDGKYNPLTTSFQQELSVLGCACLGGSLSRMKHTDGKYEGYRGFTTSTPALEYCKSTDRCQE